MLKMKPGVINKVTIHNFVTYTNVEIYPGLNLNVVIGPNGTGKSTIVAAIILGLGGTPKTIGRGTKVSEYVKHDCSEARIDIELHGKDINSIHTVTRIFNLNNQSTWYLNNKHASEHEVKELVQNLNIQVNNLCQFLPQDRVQDFAKMDKKELLVNTQKAVGRQDLVDKHTNLINIRNEQKTYIKDIESLNTKLEQANSEISRLEGKVQNLNEKKKILAEIDSVKRKIAWENYNNLVKTHQSVEKDKKQAADVINKYKKKIQPVENKINEARRQINVFQNNLVQIRNAITINERKIKNLLEKDEDIDNQRKEIIISLNAQLEALTEYHNEVEAMKAKIDKLINDENSLIQQYGSENQIDSNAEKLAKESNTFRVKSEEYNRQRISAMNVLRKSEENARQLEESLQEMDNIKEKRLQILQRRDRDAYSAVLWLRQNKNLFQGEVYEPILLELNVIDPSHAKYLENIVPMRDRVAFTCEYREDMNLLLQRVRDEQGLKINVLHSGPDHPPLTAFRPNIPIEQLRSYGFFAYVSSLITGPEAIIKYLCRMYAIHNIPIGDKETYNKAGQVPEQLRLFFSESHRFAVNVSRYTGEKSTRISDAESDGTFSVCIDYNSMNSIKRELVDLKRKHEKMKEKINEFESQKVVFENQRSEKLKERQNILQQKNQIETIRDRLASAKNMLKKFMEGHKTEEQIRNEAKKKLMQVVSNSMKLQKTICETFINYEEDIKKERKINIEYNIIQEQITHMENEVVDLRNEYEEAKITYNKVESVYKKTLEDVENALRIAKKLSDGYSPKDRGFQKFQEKYDALPIDINELNNIISELQTRIECILTADDGEIQAYENGQKTIAQCKEQLAIKEKKMSEYNIKVQTLYKEWIEPLQEFIDRINSNFGNYFESMGCAGEVAISQDAGIDEYSEYGLCIRVTYRAGEPLQELNRYVQSGGERTVATAVYMLSMQDLTAAPFRCVDEINQGMDPQNERRIFEILVRATTKTNTCQYFLITPKLITALQFGKAMKIHIVHNGPYCEIGTQFDIDRFIERQRAAI